MFRGSITAIVTPFRGEAVDWKAFDILVERQIEAGSHGIVVCGTTGESPTLTHQEHMDAIRRAVNVAKGRIPVIAGTGSNATAKTIEMTQQAHKDGADAALIVAPYYNKPTQEGLYAHYKTVAESVNMPLIVYNIPGRCVVDIQNETMARLAEIPNIIGVKDATGDLARPRDLMDRVGSGFIQLSGDDANAIAMLESGGHGCVSVTSNVTPALCAQLQDAWAAGNQKEAGTIHEKLRPLHEALFVETNPSPVKYALKKLGFCTDDVRLPLVPASAHCRNIVDDALQAVGTLSSGQNPARTAHG
jgi:4-hydroxy-tetrahydrodipicolinate synthase